VPILPNTIFPILHIRVRFSQKYVHKCNFFKSYKYVSGESYKYLEHVTFFSLSYWANFLKNTC
jgi:hypothetical protein